MKTQSPDVSAENEKLCFDLLRQIGLLGRRQLARELTSATIYRERLHIGEQHPEGSKQQVALEWARLNHGNELIDHLVSESNRRQKLD